MKARVWILVVTLLASFAATVPIFHLCEAPVNASVRGPFDSLWWWVVTSATVGYGDVVPVTVPGRLAAIVAIVTGFFIYTNAVALIAESVHAFVDRKQRGTAPVRWTGHIVLCEYTAITDEMIQSFQRIPRYSGCQVAIVTELVSRSPYPHCAFVHGVPLSPIALRQANTAEAAQVFIFANLRFADPDVKTLHIAARVRKINRGATIYVELVNPTHDLLAHVGANVVVMESRRLIESVLRNEPIDPDRWLAPRSEQ